MTLISLLASGNNDVDVVSTVLFKVLVYREFPCLSRLGCLFTVSPLTSHVRGACLPWVSLLLTIFIMILFIHEANVQSYFRLLQGTNSSAFENVSQFLTKYLL